MIARAAMVAAITLAMTATTARAQDGAETQANLDRAAAYWHASPNCPSGVTVIYDQAAVTDANNAIAGGCRIWVGDKYQAEPPAQRCQTIVHEWGHLIGWGEDHAWHQGIPDDPVGVMASGALPPACAALTPPPALPVAPQSARADGNTGGAMLNIQPAGADALLVGAVQAADAYWTRMGLAPPCPAVLYLYDDTYEDAQAAADAGGCRVWVTRRARRSAELGFLTQFCGTMTHERGHNILGDPDHTSGWPIMRHDTDGTRPIPTECYAWAKTVEPPKARGARRAAPRRPANWSRTHAGRVRWR